MTTKCLGGGTEPKLMFSTYLNRFGHFCVTKLMGNDPQTDSHSLDMSIVIGSL